MAIGNFAGRQLFRNAWQTFMGYPERKSTVPPLEKNVRVSPRWQKRISLGFGLTSAVINLAILSFLYVNRAVVASADISVVEPLLSTVTVSFLAVLLVYNRPENKISGLMLVMALLRQTGYAHTVADVLLAQGHEPTAWLLWAGVLWPTLSGLTYTLLAYIMVLFPSGEMLSPRWRKATWLLALQVVLTAGLILFVTVDLLRGFAAAAASGGAITPVPLAASGPYAIGLHVRTIPGLASLSLVIASIALALIVLGLWSQVRRFRHGSYVERQQIKWVILAVTLWAIALPLAVLPTGISFTVIVYVGPLPVIAIAVAILRYRLYDIDLIIRRTLVYSVLTALLAIFYFGSVALLQSLLTAQAQGSPVTIVFSTLLIVALFAPLRARIQGFIDRRFYRRKYNARQTLTRFAATARDEVDLDELASELVGVVEGTMQPESITLWLKERQ